MQQPIGQRLLSELKELARNFNLIEDKPGVYSFTSHGLRSTIVAVPGKELGINLELSDSGRPLLFYSVDSDLYKLDDPTNYEVNTEVEDEIIAIVQAIKHEEVIIGEMKGRKAFVLPLKDTVKLVYQGRFTISTKEYKSYEELLAKSKFVPETSM